MDNLTSIYVAYDGISGKFQMQRWDRTFVPLRKLSCFMRCCPWHSNQETSSNKHRRLDSFKSILYRIVNLCSLKINPSELKINCDQNYINTSDLVITSLFAYGLVCLKSTPITRCKLFFMFNVLCQHCQPILVYSMSHVRKPWLIVIYDLYDIWSSTNSVQPFTE